MVCNLTNTLQTSAVGNDQCSVKAMRQTYVNLTFDKVLHIITWELWLNISLRRRIWLCIMYSERRSLFKCRIEDTVSHVNAYLRHPAV